MPPTKYIRRGDKIILKDGTFAYYGDNYIRKSDIHAVCHDGIWCTYEQTRISMVGSIFRYIFS